jgi:Tol biopolymer transport system component
MRRSSVFPAVVFGLAACGDSSGPGIVTLSNALAYVQGNDVYVTEVDSGAAPVRVATGFAGPSWSPDGRQLGLVSRNSPSGIFVVEATGGTPRRLTKQVAATDAFGRAAWSPDGGTLVFNYRDRSTPNHSLYVLLKRVSIDGTGYDTFIPGQQVGSGALSESADWAPDGTRVAFDDEASICLADPDGSHLQCLARGAYPEWSPDGTTLAFGTYDADKIFTIRRDGSNQQDLTAGLGGFNYFPSWSPDGSQLAFAHQDSASVPAVYMLVNADGSGHTVLAPTVAGAGEIAWSSDGVHLALTGRIGGEADSRIYVIGRDGTDLRAVTDSTACCIEWQP